MTKRQLGGYPATTVVSGEPLAAVEDVGTGEVRWSVPTHRLTRRFVMVAAALLALGAVGKWMDLSDVGFPGSGNFVELTYLGGEANLPATFTTFLLGLTALLTALVTHRAWRRAERWVAHWRVLTLVFTFLALDELLSIHEKLVAPLRLLFANTPLASAGWVVPYSLMAAGLFLWFLAFFRALPRRVAVQMIAAGLIYVVGAAGMEVVGDIIDIPLADASQFVLLTARTVVEEGLEMGGVILFLHALLTYVRDCLGGIALRLSFPAGP